MKKIFALIAVLFPLLGITQGLQFNKALEYPGGDQGINQVAFLPDGSFYMLSHLLPGYGFDFDPGPDTLAFGPFGSGVNFVISKYTASGKMIWAKRIGREQKTEASGLVLGENHRFYVAGHFSHYGNLDPDSAQFTIPGLNNNIFLSHYDSSGRPIWTKTFSTQSSNLSSEFFTRDSKGQFYIAGRFLDSVDIDPGPGQYLLRDSKGHLTFFVAKYSPTGDFLFGFALPNNDKYSVILKDLEVDSNENIYLSGLFGDTIDIDPGSQVHTIGSVGSSAFLAKFNSTGNFQWATNTSSPNNMAYFGDGMKNIALAPGGFIYQLVNYQDTVLVNTISGQDTFYAANPEFPLLVIKVDSLGRCLWAKTTSGGIFSPVLCKAMVMPNQSIYIGGGYYGQVDLDPGSGVKMITSTQQSPLIVHYDSSMNYLDASTFYSTNGYANWVKQITINPQGYFTALFTAGGRVNLSPDSSVHIVKTAMGALAYYSISPATGIISVKGAREILCFPNPTRNELHIVSEKPINRIEVRNTLGNILQIIESPVMEESILYTAAWPDGIYFVTVLTKYGTSTVKFIKTGGQ